MMKLDELNGCPYCGERKFKRKVHLLEHIKNWHSLSGLESEPALVIGKESITPCRIYGKTKKHYVVKAFYGECFEADCKDVYKLPEEMYKFLDEHPFHPFVETKLFELFAPEDLPRKKELSRKIFELEKELNKARDEYKELEKKLANKIRSKLDKPSPCYECKEALKCRLK